jgi:hypothetical protein
VKCFVNCPICQIVDDEQRIAVLVAIVRVWVALDEKQRFLVRVSGRLKIAQRFIAGIVQMQGTQSVKRRLKNVDVSVRYPSAVRSTDYNSCYFLIPAVNCWAIIVRPLARTDKATFCATHALRYTAFRDPIARKRLS